MAIFSFGIRLEEMLKNRFLVRNKYFKMNFWERLKWHFVEMNEILFYVLFLAPVMLLQEKRLLGHWIQRHGKEEIRKNDTVSKSWTSTEVTGKHHKYTVTHPPLDNLLVDSVVPLNRSSGRKGHHAGSDTISHELRSLVQDLILRHTKTFIQKRLMNQLSAQLWSRSKITRFFS